MSVQKNEDTVTVLAVREEAKAPTLLRPIVRPDELLEAQKEITQLIVQALADGTDYGLVPGTRGKKSLFKPGGERILKAFGCRAEYTVIEREADHDRENKYEKMVWLASSRRKEAEPGTSRGLYRYVVNCSIYEQGGRCVGSSIGSCSTMESKYIDRPRDVENVILKMAQKRAMVGAVLNTFGLSDRFTQDVEDLPRAAEPEPEKPEGYDPQDRRMQQWLETQLKKANVDERLWPNIGSAMRGRPSTDFAAVVAQVTSA